MVSRNAILRVLTGNLIEEVEVVYRTLPRATGHYMRNENKIYITPIAKKYPRYHPYIKRHEKTHAAIEKHWKYPIVIFIHLLHDWRDSLLYQINPFRILLILQALRCENEWRKEVNKFSPEQKKQIELEFYEDLENQQRLEEIIYWLFYPMNFLGVSLFAFVFCRSLKTLIFRVSTPCYFIVIIIHPVLFVLKKILRLIK